MRSSSRSTSSMAALMLVSSAALADVATPGPTDEQKAAARMLGTEGVRLALGGDCSGAVDKLTRAESLVHAPTTALPLARCDIKLGKLVAGTEILNRLVRETLPPNPPKSWIDAQAEAQPLLDSTTPRIGQLRIHVDRPLGASGSIEVTVDGEAVPSVLLDNDRPTDPGMHHITATGPGLTVAETDTPLGEGQVQPVALRLEPSPTATGETTPGSVPVAAGPATIGLAPVSPETSPSPHRVPAYVLLGVGGAGVAVGAVFGILALNAKSSLDSKCQGHVCPVTSQSDINAYKTDPIVSTVGWSVGIVGLAVGTVLFFTAHSETARTTAHLELEPWIGLGSGGLAGRFP
jgi:hypothetical protein